MIWIDRNRVNCPAILDLNNPNSPASRETAKAIVYVQDPTNNSKPTFSVYSDDSVKLALITLFNGKCAYCESKVNAVSARDIEHYRPKGQIDPGTGEEVIKPGYYWLAAKWDNLFLSCPGCNRRQRQLERNAAGELIFADKATGKLDLFPLRAGAQRADGPHVDLAIEEDFRLLLNPCIDKKLDKHLRFDDEGNIIPRRIQGKLSDRALKSIEIYQLKRLTLVEARKAQCLHIKRLQLDFNDISNMIHVLDPDSKNIIAASIRRKEDELLSFTKENEPYAGMARWLVKPLIRQLKEIKQQYEARFGETV